MVLVALVKKWRALLLFLGAVTCLVEQSASGCPLNRLYAAVTQTKEIRKHNWTEIVAILRELKSHQINLLPSELKKIGIPELRLLQRISNDSTMSVGKLIRLANENYKGSGSNRVPGYFYAMVAAGEGESLMRSVLTGLDRAGVKISFHDFQYDESETTREVLKNITGLDGMTRFFIFQCCKKLFEDPNAGVSGYSLALQRFGLNPRVAKKRWLITTSLRVLTERGFSLLPRDLDENSSQIFPILREVTKLKMTVAKLMRLSKEVTPSVGGLEGYLALLVERGKGEELIFHILKYLEESGVSLQEFSSRSEVRLKRPVTRALRRSVANEKLTPAGFQSLCSLVYQTEVGDEGIRIAIKKYFTKTSSQAVEVENVELENVAIQNKDIAVEQLPRSRPVPPPPSVDRKAKITALIQMINKRLSQEKRERLLAFLDLDSEEADKGELFDKYLEAEGALRKDILELSELYRDLAERIPSGIKKEWLLNRAKEFLDDLIRDERSWHITSEELWWDFAFLKRQRVEVQEEMNSLSD